MLADKLPTVADHLENAQADLLAFTVTAVVVSSGSERCYGLKNKFLKRNPSHGRRPFAEIPPRSSARPSGIRP